MLREIRDPMQITDEPPRRWFFCQEQDLIVWLNRASQPDAFQLCYGKSGWEQALRWSPRRGFSQFSVDDGERGRPLKLAPWLIEGGSCNVGALANEFTALACELPEDIREFVLERLHAHPEFAHGG
jgi:hypothetical protein